MAISSSHESKQGREITTADFELLLTLDASPMPPLHEHLLRALPVIKKQEHGKIIRNCATPAPASGYRKTRRVSRIETPGVYKLYRFYRIQYTNGNQ